MGRQKRIQYEYFYKIITILHRQQQKCYCNEEKRFLNTNKSGVQMQIMIINGCRRYRPNSTWKSICIYTSKFFFDYVLQTFYECHRICV